MGTVPAFDVAEDRQAGLAVGLEGVPVEQLALEAREERLAERVVACVADRAHRWPHSGLVAPLPERHRGVLGAMIGVMDEVEVNDIIVRGFAFLQACRGESSAEREPPAKLGMEGGFRLLTMHRPENTGNPAKLHSIMSVLNEDSSIPDCFPHAFPDKGSLQGERYQGQRPHRGN